MNDIKPLVIDKRDLVKGLHTYCAKCEKLTTTRVCGMTGKRISTCTNGESHKFKVIKSIPNTGSKLRKTKVLNTRDINEAILLKNEFESELENNGYQKVEIFAENNVELPKRIVDCMTMYLGYLNNVSVPEHKQRKRSKGYIDEVQRVFRVFCESLKANQINHMILNMDQVNDNIVGLYHIHLLESKHYSNITYNKHIATIRQFIDWLINDKKYDLDNPFLKVRRTVKIYENAIIEEQEFAKLLEVINPENGIKEYPKERKNMYRDWLKDAFRIALETGLRREEFMELRFLNVVENRHGDPEFIRIENFKVNRSKDVNDEADKQFKYIPLTKVMVEILNNLDYKNLRGTNQFIIGSDESASRKTLMDKLSKAFTHFWAKTGIEKELKLKNLRKTYLTSLAIHFGDNANLISDHASLDVLKKHYLNNKKIVSKITDFSIF